MVPICRGGPIDDDAGSPHVREPANDNGVARLKEGGGRRMCPICGKPAHAATRPFCSKRCADIDLHRWLGGTYAIPVAEADEILPDDEPSDR